MRMRFLRSVQIPGGACFPQGAVVDEMQVPPSHRNSFLRSGSAVMESEKAEIEPPVVKPIAEQFTESPKEIDPCL